MIDPRPMEPAEIPLTADEIRILGFLNECPITFRPFARTCAPAWPGICESLHRRGLAFHLPGRQAVITYEGRRALSRL